jgi:ribosomal protein RSM22 (predicted rRNA methylase)
MVVAGVAGWGGAAEADQGTLLGFTRIVAARQQVLRPTEVKAQNRR